MMNNPEFSWRRPAEQVSTHASNADVGGDEREGNHTR